MSLLPCPSCARHVRQSESGCPFCGASLALASEPSRPMPTQRLGRAATFAFGAAMATSVAACGTTTTPTTTYTGVAQEDGGTDGGVAPAYGAPSDAGSDAGMLAMYGGPPSDSGTTDQDGGGPAPAYGGPIREDAGGVQPVDSGGVAPAYGAIPPPDAAA